MTIVNDADVFFSGKVLPYRLALATSLSIAPIALVTASLWGPFVSAMTTIVLSAAIFSALIIMRRRTRNRRSSRSASEDRERLAAWLDQSLAQPAERGRLAVLAVSVEASESFYDEGEVDTEYLLSSLHQTLAQSLRDDDLIVRGDLCDFLIGLSRVRAPQMETLDRLARRLQSAADTPIKFDGRSIHPRLTIGMASSRLTDVPTGEELITAAENAYDDAISAGMGSLVLSNMPVPLSTADVTLVGQLGDALNNGQITAWYQPQLCTETGDVSGFEALARWEHPTRGVISPASFLPMINRAGLSRKLTRVILTHALSALRTWDRAGLEVPGVGVNFAADELHDPNLPDFLRWELDRFDLAPSRLVVEVLESVISESHDDAVAQNLRAISAMGCRIDLDDFGTGFTSIVNIRRFDVSRIKIDRKLVTGAATDVTQRDLIAALLSMSEHLHVDTLGEGVETNEEHLALAQLGCNHVQGFAIARPMPLGDTLAWTMDHRASIAEARALRVQPTQAR